MSEKQKYPNAAAMAVGLELQEALAPFCERIAIAGSLRRERPLVGDAELLFIPKAEDRPVDMFYSLPFDLAWEAIDFMVTAGILSKRPSSIGVFTWGPKNKHAIHRGGIPVDFFATSKEAWWVSLVIRTGGKATNLALTTGAQKAGYSLNAYGVGVTHLRTGQVIPATSERHVFELCGVPYLEPKYRA